jgi:hypothetical protein
MASGIQQGIASKYYAMADRAQTPDQINQVRQLLAKTIQSGGLPAYEGIPIVEQLNGKYQTALQQATMAGQTKAGLIPPSSQPMAQEILAQAEQPDEEEDSGIDELASNLPTEEYAEGGIVGFAEGGSAIDKALEKIFGKGNAPTITPSGITSGTPSGKYSMLSAPTTSLQGPSIAGSVSASSLVPLNAAGFTAPGTAPAGSSGISNLISNFDPKTATNKAGSSYTPAGARGPVNLNKLIKGGGDSNTLMGIDDLKYYLDLKEKADKFPNDPTFKEEMLNVVRKNPKVLDDLLRGNDSTSLLGPIANAKTSKPPEIDPRRPTALPPNVQDVVNKFKTSKKEGDLTNKPNAPAKEPAAPAAPPAAREEMGPPRDLMSMTAEAPIIDTTPKEDTISRLEKMFTQAPEQRKKERDLDFYTRLFQAGIGVASGSSRNALENLKEAQPAIAGFASDIARQREEDRNRIKDLASLGLKREEFAFKLKELGIAEKKVNSLAKHYDDYLKLGQERNKLLGQHYSNIDKNYANAAGTAGNKLESAQNIAQERNITNLIKSYAGMPSNYGKSPAQLRALAIQSLGLDSVGGGGKGTPTLSYADFSKGLK